MDQEKRSRRDRQKLYHRKVILDKAVHLFSEYGYHSVSMHRIAEESEFAIGTLYKFFQNKEDLYRALIMNLAQEFRLALDKALDIPGDEVEIIRSFIRVKGEMFMDNIPMLRIYFAETRGASFDIKTGLDTEIRQMYDALLRRLAGVFESGIKKGIFKQLLEPYYLAVTIDSLTNTFLFLWLTDPDKHPYLENIETIMELFFSNIRIDDND